MDPGCRRVYTQWSVMNTNMRWSQQGCELFPSEAGHWTSGDQDQEARASQPSTSGRRILAWHSVIRPSEPTLLSRSLTGVEDEIRFDGPGNEQFKWGFQIKHGQERHIWFKLDLDPDNSRVGKLTQLSRTLKDLFVSPPEYQRTTEDIVAAYLTGLRRHAVAHLEKLYGSAVMKDCQLDWIITVPAVWSDLAKKKTRTAAMRAGMGDTTSLQMTSEPEAAAVYALKALDPHHIKVGESVVICDAGGGTVDLITYKMKSVDYPYEVEETAIGGGSQCGSTFLNRKFEEVLMRKLNNKPISKNAKAMAMSHFEKEVSVLENPNSQL
ncbi:Hsp70 family chaperone [Histoplasma capsulatum]|uniref:Hsp70 family chaperone n=1 Tax=Ajellomyces capsulatus TaxID=5037 RepID=A0A8A1MF14_AJECA|nr:predicted protein [Histoplasma mississippiense (nom. inval.)]EDN09118.1 predicted protein [Histoplasma mississippiense (nom. inval.)]QSS63730.1 Hsp70 family chaperone [Histoplasma capsulatum]